MSLAVNTPASALLTLQSLKTGSTDTVRQGSPKNAATPAPVQDADPTLSTDAAQPSPAQLLTSNLAQGASASDAASSAARSISDLLQQLQQTATAAAQPSAGSTSATSASLASQFSSLLAQIQGVVQNAGVGGQNLIDGSLSGTVSYPTSDGSGVTLSPQNLNLGGPVISLSADASVSTPQSAAGTLASVNQSLQSVGAAIQQFDGQADQIGASLSPATAASGSQTPDDDSVRLLALQLQQSLSAQPTSIANQSSQAVLSLFRS